MKHLQTIAQFDTELAAAIAQEDVRQQQHIELIASENYCSPMVMEAQGSILTNKYTEGYPGKRYYGGCEFVDIVERLAISRAQQLFGAEFVNVQPHSGSSANSAVYMALCQPHDTVMGMSLSHGGHLTHGSHVNFSGRIYNSVQYETGENGLIDYAAVMQQARAQQPKLLIAGFSAYSQVIDWQEFRKIADEVGAYLLVDMAHVAGLVATGHYPSPIGIADVVTTTTHKTLRGARGGMILATNADIAKKIDSAIFPGYQGGPLMHAVAAKAVALYEALQPQFKDYQQRVVDNAKVLAQRLMDNEIDIVSNGTENHLMVLNLSKNAITGKELATALGDACITVNKNTVPNDPKSPFITSGIRIGTPAITTRGFTEDDCKTVADWITEIIHNIADSQKIASIREQVIDLCSKRPIYGSWQ